MAMDTGTEYENLVAQYKGKEIAECFANMHMSFRHELDVIRGTVSKVEERVSELEKFATHANQSLNELGPKINQTVSEEKNERLKLEIWGRKWNLIITGVEGGLQEKARETLGKVKKFFVEKLHLSEELVGGMIFQAAHRLRGGREKTRNIIVRFSSLIDRDDVLEAGMKLQRGSGYSVFPDLPPEIGKLRAKLLKRRREMPADERKKMKFVYMKEYPFVALVNK